MNYPYIVNIPGSGDKPSQSQPNLQTNCNSLNSIFGVEHSALTVGNGKHKYITLNRSPSAPGPTGNDMVLTQEIVNSTVSLRAQNTTVVSQDWRIPLTAYTQTINASSGSNIFDFTPYPGTAGWVLVYRGPTNQSDQIFTSYVFPTGDIPKVNHGTLVSGGPLLSLTTSGNNLVILMNGTHTLNVLICWTAIP